MPRRPGGGGGSGGDARISDRPQIVTRVGDNRLSGTNSTARGGRLEEDHQRADTAPGQRLGTQHVYSYPSRVSAETDYRIVLALRRFDGIRRGGESGCGLVTDRRS